MVAPVLGVVLTSVVGVGLLVSCGALAGSGRVYFRGAVVESTCHSSRAEQLAASRPDGSASRVVCVDPVAEAATAASTVPAYSLQVMPLSAVPAERLLAPFESYADGDRPQDVVRLVTRVYE